MKIRPLGGFERALFLSDAYSPFNVVGVLQLDNCPPPETLRRALSVLQNRHPFLQAHIESIHGRPFFMRMEPSSLPLFVLDRETEEQWLEVAESELNRHLDVAQGPLFRIQVLARGSRAELVFTFHHTIIDAASLVNLLADLLRACEAGETNQPSGFPSSLSLAPAVESRFPPSLRGPARLWPLFTYAVRQMADELHYQVNTRRLRRPPVRLGGRARILTMEFDPSLTEALVRRSRKEKVPLNSLFNAAMLQAVNRKLYGGRSLPMRTFSFPDLRPYTSPPLPAQDLAAYISMLRYTVQVGGRQSLWELGRSLQAQIYRSLKRGDKFAASLMSEGLMKMLLGLKSMRMAATALSYTGVAGLEPTYGDIRVRGLHGFISNIDLGPEYSAQVNLLADRLIWDIVYLDTDMGHAEALAIADEIRALLTAAL